MVVSSRGSKSITRDGELAVAPYGGGEITIRRDSGKVAKTISHYLGGSTIQGSVPIQDNQLTIKSSYRDSSGRPLEWIEIHIS